MASLTVTAKGGFWETYNNSQLTLKNDGPMKRRAARLLDLEGMRAYRALNIALTGAAVGGTATKTHSRILAREDSTGQLGGKRTIETVTDVNRATTAADETDVDTKLFDFPDKTTTPANGDLNPRQYPGG